MASSTDTVVWERLLTPLVQSLTPPLAERLVGLRADEQTQAKVDELARLANEGLLTPAQRQQYESFVRAGTLLAVLQAKARKVLEEQSPS
jgi:hypothetical protein